MKKARGRCLDCPTVATEWIYMLFSALLVISLITTAVLDAMRPRLPYSVQTGVLATSLKADRTVGEAEAGVPAAMGSAAPLFRVPEWGQKLVDTTNGRPETVDFLFPELTDDSERELWSRIQCTGHRLNRTCLVENMYYFGDEEQFLLLLPTRTRLTGRVKSTPYKQAMVGGESLELVHSELSGLKGDRSGIHSLMSNCSDYFKGQTFTPKILYFSTALEAVDWLNTLWSSRPPTLVPGTTGYGYSMYPHNHGHLLYDGLYPIYVSLVRFGYADVPFNLVVKLEDPRGGQRYLADELFPIFTGGGFYSRLNELQDTVYRFEIFVMGSRRMAHRSFKTDGTLPGSYTFENALYLFTGRLLSLYKLDTPHFAELVEGASKECTGVIVDNKRFTHDDRDMLEAIARNSVETLKCKIRFVRWNEYSFREQLRLFSQSDIYISGVGTGMTRAHLARPGGVVINLGEFIAMGDPERLLAGYQDVQFAVGAAYLNVLYYPRKLWNVFGRLRKEPIMVLLKEAVARVRAGSALPRPMEDGFGPSTRPMVDYCRQRPELCIEIDGQLNAGDSDEYSEWCDWCSWPDYFGLVPMWRRGEGCVYRKKTVKCRLDHDVFEKVVGADHAAFDGKCHREQQPRMDEMAQDILRAESARLGTSVDELDPAVATKALLEMVPPNCPPRWPSANSACDCFDIRR
ncbi:hypothetical protein FOL47_003579 [Perkinsus chesapeaki]|uniref:Uncharacterized protein n=1 Tax=Perkinsus chesapeaki TaxID=330153 RepID=A0A7J6M7B6_PERCH|nr:hypothetical protein FOL47_003579 [Perkinsus chesapeaki]